MWVNTVVGQMEMKVRVSDGLRDAERRRQLFAHQGDEAVSEARGKMAAVIRELERLKDAVRSWRPSHPFRSLTQER